MVGGLGALGSEYHHDLVENIGENHQLQPQPPNQVVPLTWRSIPWLGYVVNNHGDRLNVPQDLGQPGTPDPNGRTSFMADGSTNWGWFLLGPEELFKISKKVWVVKLQIIVYFHPYLGKMMNPFWLIFFKGVETTN